MEKSQESVVLQLRKPVEKLGLSTEKYEDPTMMRFLISRSMDPEKASKMFVQRRKWRTALVPSRFISESEVPDELEAKKVYLQGLSKKGFPIVIVKGSRHYPPKDQVQFKKFVAHILDKTIARSFKGREIGNEKLIGILDRKDIAYKNVDARALITGFQFLQIVIVSNEDEKRDFIREVGEEALPEEYGGYSKFIPIQDAVVTPLNH